MSNTQWTAEKDRRLATLYATNQSIYEIAAQLGCTEQSLRTRVSTLGLLRRRTKATGEGRGNARWVLGATLASVMHVPDDAAFDDLLSQLDTVIPA